MPKIELLEEVPLTGDEKADKRLRWDREQHWKKILRSEGHDLLNGVPGRRKGQTFAEGQGPRKLKGRKRPELSEKLTGRSLSAEHREKLKAVSARRWEKYREQGLQDDPEAKAKRTAAAKLAWERRRSRQLP